MTRLERGAVLLVAVAATAGLFAMVFGRAISLDEVEYFRAAAWVGQGLLPYRDFWEHHAPLQWYLTAPFTPAALTSRGITPFIMMRFVQAPFWIATAVLLMLWMRTAGISRSSRWLALAIGLSSWTFVFNAIEFRVDTVACFFFVLGLWLMWRCEPWAQIASGAALAAAATANLRFVPLVVIAALLYTVFDPVRSSWRVDRSAVRLFGGATILVLLFITHLAVTGSAADAWQSLIVFNATADAVSPRVPLLFVARVAAPWGLLLDPQSGAVAYSPSSLDPAAMALWIGAAAASWLAVMRRGTSKGVGFLLVILGAALLTIARTPAVYAYHFEVSMLLMIPALGFAIDRARLRGSILFVAAALCTAVLALNAFLRPQDDVRAGQDAAVRLVHRVTRPADRVFDPVGWAYRRTPAWEYWFIPSFVNVLERSGTIPPLSPERLRDDPPGAVIHSYRSFIYLSRNERVARYLTTHYLPLSLHVWVPALSGKATRQGFERIVPRTAAYNVYSSPGFLRHPWFVRPLLVGMPALRELELRLDLPAAPRPGEVRVQVNGRTTVTDRPLILERGDRVRVTAERETAVLVVPVGTRQLFVDHGSVDPFVQLPAVHLPDL